MLMYVLLTFRVIGILRRGGLVYAERIRRGFSEEIGAEVFRRGMMEETHHRKQYVRSLCHSTCGRESQWNAW